MVHPGSGIGRIGPMDELVTIATLPDQLRGASLTFQALSMSQRLAIVSRFRRLLAMRATSVARTLGDTRPLADTLSAEVLPLLEAARFLERRAVALLASRRLGISGRPLWLAGIDQVVTRVPYGAVLILGPSNFPIMLAGIQALQALVAGNAVAWKPGRGGYDAARAVALLLAEAGLPIGLLHVADESDATGKALVDAGFDRIVLTGSAVTGRAVLARAAGDLTPCTVELSGADPMFILPGADLSLAARCLAYGLRLNGSATCIAPRRVIGSASSLAMIERALSGALTGQRAVPVPAHSIAALRALVVEAVGRGARMLGSLPEPAADAMTPVIIADAPHDLGLLSQDIFAPWFALVPVADLDGAAAAERAARYVLGASVFGPTAAATALAARLPSGAVTVNDIIVPTADPRLGFGGGRDSGFGTTRGPEGLLEMTRLRTISIRRPRGFRPHLDQLLASDHVRMAGLIELLHAGAGRSRAVRRLLGRVAR